MFQPRIAVLMLCAALTTLTATSTLAQGAGRISGTVRDANGAPLGGAPVTITNQGTLATRVARTSSAGAYAAADLPPGLYTVSVDVQGFRKVIQRDQRLGA